MPVDPQTLEYIYSILQAMSLRADWKTAFDTLLTSLRKEFVYDNVVVYLLDAEGKSLDVGFARAVGRGKQSEADVSWGEGIAGKVIAKKDVIVQEPSLRPRKDRLDLPYLIGLPLFMAGRLGGVLLFVRFGGPPYTQAHLHTAKLISMVAASLLESNALREARAGRRT